MFFLNGARRGLAFLLAVCLAHNPVVASYLSVGFLFAVPARVAADAFTDKAAQGQGVGTSLLNSFTPPSVSQSTGTITLQNGKAGGQTVEQSAMFQ